MELFALLLLLDSRDSLPSLPSLSEPSSLLLDRERAELPETEGSSRREDFPPFVVDLLLLLRDEAPSSSSAVLPPPPPPRFLPADDLSVTLLLRSRLDGDRIFGLLSMPVICGDPLPVPDPLDPLEDDPEAAGRSVALLACFVIPVGRRYPFAP